VHLVLAHPAVSSVVLGMSTPEQVRRNAGLLDAAPPVDLWPDLVARGLLDPAVPVPV
jgi:D-threo-aldose 1-dehydrogenase